MLTLAAAFQSLKPISRRGPKIVKVGRGIEHLQLALGASKKISRKTLPGPSSDDCLDALVLD
jgi:hypothetical protein